MALRSTVLIHTILLTAAPALHAGPDSGQTASNARSVSADGTTTSLTDADRNIADIGREVLADILDVPMSSIDIDSVRAVNWPDTSIGCPQPDRAYAQVIVPGHKITLRVADALYVLNEANGQAGLCRNRKGAQPATAVAEDFGWTRLAALARSDLAERLSIDETHVLVRNAGIKRWPSSALGCDEIAGDDVDTNPVDGYVLTLRHGSRDYTYHTSKTEVLACPPITLD